MVKANNILSLTSEDAISYFLQSENYQTFELPEYFVFDNVINFVKNKIGNKTYNECIKRNITSNDSCINFDILLNKDGKYAVRPLTLSNPYLYYFLVREICSKKGWIATLDCFEKYHVPHITCCALPVVKLQNEKEPFHKSTTILNWWNSIEQRSLELSLKYRYMFVTDITNCYGSINPQVIDWALSRKGTKHETDENHQMAKNIITYINALQNGRNIGIPQGSSIYDMVAEFILGYADLLLYEKLNTTGIQDYEILRYRDDYRVFCNNKDKLEKISYIIQHILESLNLRLNSKKTKITDSIITDSIKPDKLYYIKNTPIFNKKGVDFDGIQKHLLFILMFGREYPNGGQLKNLLTDLDKRIQCKLKPHKSKVLYSFNRSSSREQEEPGKIVENIRAMAAISTQIAIENVSIAHYALRVFSRLVDSIEDNKEKYEIITSVCDKLSNRPNSSYDKIWLQNITYQRDKEIGRCPYDERLCKVVAGEKVSLWNNTWLKDELLEGFSTESIIDNESLSKITPVITFRETRAYYDPN